MTTPDSNTPIPGPVGPLGATNIAPEGQSTGEVFSEAENGSEDHTGSKLHQEAARYRTQLRATEADLASAQERINQMQQREAERVAASDLANPADLFTLGGVTVEDLLNEDGEIDAERVAEIVAEVLGTRPGLKKLSQVIDPTQGLGGTPKQTLPQWGDLFR